jgi:hypothetical protein
VRAAELALLTCGVASLSPGTQYYFRVVASNSSVTETSSVTVITDGDAGLRAIQQQVAPN